ncbi:MAG TPA: hypothetical protein VJ739_11835 [Gemmataceae bacterium]|nr:hypothetical protein [Gemmataceae bacterium]
MTSTEALFRHTADRIRDIYDQFPDGIDPDFDAGLEELEYQLAELRTIIANH